MTQREVMRVVQASDGSSVCRFGNSARNVRLLLT
jgi:hypothetical protein